MGPDPEAPEPQRTAEFNIQRVRSHPADTRLSLATGVAVLLVTLAILKPWGSLGVPATAPPRPIVTAEPVGSPAATATTPEGLAGPVCLGTGGWRIASLETWRTQDVRVWRALEPAVDAIGPLDQAIPVVPIIALEVQAMGFCAPAYGPDKPVGPANVAAWRVEDGRATDLPLLQVLPEEGTTPYAALYRPLGGCNAAGSCPGVFPRVARPWETGRVVFRYTDEGMASVAWFAVDLTIVPDTPTGSAPPAGE